MEDDYNFFYCYIYDEQDDEYLKKNKYFKLNRNLFFLF